ncbi:Hypothetical protein A7982_05439 [Minicystis rosea]|nr:Hypothetical protein A7982_05439 [Minicystis rosea]
MAWAAVTLVTLLQGCCTGGFCSEPDIVRHDLFLRRVTAGAEQLHLVAMDCHDGDAQACLALGTVYENGIEVPASKDLARDAFRAACALDPNYCPGAESFERQIASLRGSERRCAAGDDARACTEAARMYLEGHIAAQDVKHARALYERACPVDRVPGSAAVNCDLFAYMLLTGWGGPKDEQRALRLLTHGSPYETFAVELGLGVPKDLSAAHDRYESMCNHPTRANRKRRRWQGFHSEGSNPFSCYRLGVMYQEGRGAPRDPRQAARLFFRACAQRNTDVSREAGDNDVVMQLACLRGAVLFLQNDVDPFSEDWNGIRGFPALHARRMLELGCWTGNRASCRGLRQLRSVLGDAVIVEDPRQ